MFRSMNISRWDRYSVIPINKLIFVKKKEILHVLIDALNNKGVVCWAIIIMLRTLVKYFVEMLGVICSTKTSNENMCSERESLRISHK
jgi:hypothetical protein